MQRLRIPSSPRSSRNPGFTLIELVIVMVILSTLAALVIPKLSFLQQQSVPVSGAATSQDVMNNLETFKTTTGFYPLRLDSLLTQSGALIPQLFGMG
ncbi:MAG TPA: prepilin-type N-terminal cleavage/methylation domain-containing protein, partial [Pirellulales bacterium]